VRRKRQLVAIARRQGLSWQRIGDVLRISPSAAQKKYGSTRAERR
jgi:hypothetical protein